LRGIIIARSEIFESTITKGHFRVSGSRSVAAVDGFLSGCRVVAGRGRPPEAAARRAGLEGVEKSLPAPSIARTRRSGTPALLLLRICVPYCCIAGRAGYWPWLRVVLVIVAVAHRRLGPSSSASTSTRERALPSPPGAASGPGSPDGYQELAKAEDHRGEPDQATKDGDQGQNPQDPSRSRRPGPKRAARGGSANQRSRPWPRTRTRGGAQGWISQPSWCIPSWPEESSRSARPAGHGGDSR
jgi:hypothetical protein